jgi:hypothetical protein
MTSERYHRWAWILVTAALGCSSTAGVENGDLDLAGSGTLVGRVSIGPICPVEREDQPCPVPPAVYAGVDVLVLTELGNDPIARIDLDDAGRYRKDLPGGSYRVTLEHELGIPPGDSPTHVVTIRPGQTTDLDFEIDTGIR